MFDESYGNITVRTLNTASKLALEAAEVLSPRKILLVALPGDEAAFAASLEQIDMTEISPNRARGLVPIISPDVTYAAIYERSYDIDTDQLLQSYAKQTRANGANIRTAAPIQQITKAGCWTLISGTERFQADIIVNAAGAWADNIADLAGVSPLGLQPYRRSMARMAAPGGHDAHHWPMLFGAGESWYAKPDAGGWIISPAEEDPMQPMDAWADDMVLAEGIARYQPHVTEPVTRITANWAGLRTFAPDRSLVIGQDPTIPGFYWCAAQGGYGFQTAPAASDLLAATITGSTPAIPMDAVRALSPARFR